VVLLEFAYISFPAKVVFVDEANRKIICIGWGVLNVSIEPLVIIAISNLNLGFVVLSNLNVLVLDWLSNYLVLRGDDSHLHCI